MMNTCFPNSSRTNEGACGGVVAVVVAVAVAAAVVAGSGRGVASAVLSKFGTSAVGPALSGRPGGADCEPIGAAQRMEA